MPDLKSLSETELDKLARDTGLESMDLERRLMAANRLIEAIDIEMVDRTMNQNAVVLNEEDQEVEVQDQEEDNFSTEEDLG